MGITSLRDARRKAGFKTQSALAKKCRCATGTIGTIERGRFTPSEQLAKRIAAAVKMSPEELFQPSIRSNRDPIRQEIDGLLDRLPRNRLVRLYADLVEIDEELRRGEIAKRESEVRSGDPLPRGDGT